MNKDVIFCECGHDEDDHLEEAEGDVACTVPDCLCTNFSVEDPAYVSSEPDE